MTPKKGPKQTTPGRRSRDERAELRQLRTVVETAGDVLFLTDREGVFTYVNPAFTRLYDHTRDDVVGRVTPRVLKSGLMPADRYEELWRTLLDGRVATMEFVNTTRRGDLVEVEGSANPVVDEAGAIVGFLAVQRDVTERNRALRSIRRWGQVFDHITIGLAMAEGDSERLSMVNPALARLYGYEVDEMVGLEIGRLFEPSRRAEVRQHIEQVQHAGSVGFETVHVRRGTASRFRCRSSSTPSATMRDVCSAGSRRSRTSPNVCSLNKPGVKARSDITRCTNRCAKAWRCTTSSVTPKGAPSTTASSTSSAPSSA